MIDQKFAAKQKHAGGPENNPAYRNVSAGRCLLDVAPAKADLLDEMQMYAGSTEEFSQPTHKVFLWFIT